MTTNTTIAQKAARRKLSLLELASDLDNVSKACKIMGYQFAFPYLPTRCKAYRYS